jgi:hypothetical protein
MFERIVIIMFKLNIKKAVVSYYKLLNFRGISSYSIKNYLNLITKSPKEIIYPNMIDKEFYLLAILDKNILLLANKTLNKQNPKINNQF